MQAFGARFDPSVRLLLELLREPATALGASERDWDGVVRVARVGRLLAPLGARLADRGVLERIPPAVRSHIESEQVLAAHGAQMVGRLLGELDRVLGRHGFPVVLLKGAAYLTQGLACARGRLFADVDLLVPGTRLDEVERLLREAGWAYGELDAYDERYYRKWSHELPPLRHSGHATELDVHHTILPPVGRVRPDAEALLESAIAIPDSPYRALAPADQVLHACAHVFQDSDCAGKLRDLVDIDSLLREHAAVPGFWMTLLDHAMHHGLGRCLWYATRYATVWLGTPVPYHVTAQMARYAPVEVIRSAMDRLISAAMLPGSPDARPALGARVARMLLLARWAWLRMPPWLLAYHTCMKLVRRMRRVLGEGAAT